MSVHLYFAPSVMKLGGKDLAPQTVWAVFANRKIGNKSYWEVVVVGTDDTKHLVDDATYRKASEGSMPFAFGIEVLCPNGVKDVPVEELEQFRVESEVAAQQAAAQKSSQQTQGQNDQATNNQSSKEKELIELVRITGNSGTALERTVRLHQIWRERGVDFRLNEKAYALLLDKFRDAALDAADEGANWRGAPLDVQLRHVGARIALAKGDKRVARIKSWESFYEAIEDSCGKGSKISAVTEVLKALRDDKTDWDQYSAYALVEFTVKKIEQVGGNLSAQATFLKELATSTLPRMRKKLEYAKALDDSPVYAQITYTERYLTGGICDVLTNPMFEAWNSEPNAAESPRLESWFAEYTSGMDESNQRNAIKNLLTIINCMCPTGTEIVVESNGNIKIPFTPKDLPSYGSFARYLINVASKNLEENALGNPTDSPFVLPYLMQCADDDSIEKRLGLMDKVRRSYESAMEQMVNSGGKEGVRKVRALAQFINIGMPGLQLVNKEKWRFNSLESFLDKFCKPYIKQQWNLRKSDPSLNMTNFALRSVSQILSSIAHWRNDAESFSQWEEKYPNDSRLYRQLNAFYSSHDFLKWVRENLDEVAGAIAARDEMINSFMPMVEPALERIRSSGMTVMLADDIDSAMNEFRVKAAKSPYEVYEELRKWFDAGNHSMMLPVSLSTTIDEIWTLIRKAVIAAKSGDRVDVFREQCSSWRDMLIQLRPLNRDVGQWSISAKYAPDNIYEAMSELKTAMRSENAVAKVKSFVTSDAVESATSTIWEVHRNEAKVIWTLGNTVICYASLVENVKALRSKLSKLPDTTEAEADFAEGRQDSLLMFDRGITVDGLRTNFLHKWIAANPDNLGNVGDLLDTFLDTLMEMRPLKMQNDEWTDLLPPSLLVTYKFILNLQLNPVALSRETNIALGKYDSLKVPELDVNKEKNGKIAHRKIKVSGSETYSTDTPDIPASGIAIPELFDMASPLAQRLVNAIRAQSSVWFLDQSITEDLAKYTKYIGLKKRLPLDNFVVVGGNDGSSCATVSLAGKRVGVLTLDPVQIARLTGGFTTTSILHVATHEIAHFIFRQLKNTEKMEWRKEIAGRKLHPRQGVDAYGFETEQFAILAETMVWGNSFRGLYNTNGMSVVEKYFYNNFLTEEDKKKRA